MKAFESITGHNTLSVSLKNLWNMLKHVESKHYDAALLTIQEAIDSLEETNSVMKSDCNLDYR